MIEIDGIRAGHILLRDQDGHRHAAPVNAVRGIHELDDGTAIALPGRVVVVPDDFEYVVALLGWTRGGGR